MLNFKPSIAVSLCYWLVAASIAELASGMPSASGGMFVLFLLLFCPLNNEFLLTWLTSLPLGFHHCW